MIHMIQELFGQTVRVIALPPDRKERGVPSTPLGCTTQS
jgi:hypothetical protein